MKWFLYVLKHYATFTGRASRTEFWMFALFNALFAIACLIIDNILGTERILYAVYMLAVLVPTIAVSVRRLHDIGRTGWWYLLNFVPFGAFVILVFDCLPSEPADNQYGIHPDYINYNNPQKQSA
ncbi:DUF805 domain-containing protein [Paenibacillus sp. WLX1005]|uniref:DUF805 domain-containing protein n=1 Tax=Paenibacillus sp. WLX1005 TaxID=3243766 RepID=UPI003984060C